MKVRIEILTPTIIRSNVEHYWFEFYQRGDKLDLIDMDRTMLNMEYNELRKFRDILEKINSTKVENLYVELNNFYAYLEKNNKLVKSWKGIKIPNIKNPFSIDLSAQRTIHLPIHYVSEKGFNIYIPGSSVKGMFFNALYNLNKNVWGDFNKFNELDSGKFNLLKKFSTFFSFSDFIPEDEIELTLYTLVRSSTNIKNSAVFISKGKFVGDFYLKKDTKIAKDNFEMFVKKLNGIFNINSKSYNVLSDLERDIFDVLLIKSENFIKKVASINGNIKLVNDCNGSLGAFRGLTFINLKTPKTYFYIQYLDNSIIPGQVKISKVV